MLLKLVYLPCFRQPLLRVSFYYCSKMFYFFRSCKLFYIHVSSSELCKIHGDISLPFFNYSSKIRNEKKQRYSINTPSLDSGHWTDHLFLWPTNHAKKSITLKLQTAVKFNQLSEKLKIAGAHIEQGQFYCAFPWEKL